MSEQEIKSNFCYYDPKNPNNNLDAYEDEDRPQPRKKCYCDNCFYGSDKLAMQLLEVKRERDEAIEILKEAYWYATATSQKKIEKILRKINKLEGAK